MENEQASFAHKMKDQERYKYIKIITIDEMQIYGFFCPRGHVLSSNPRYFPYFSLSSRVKKRKII